MTVHTNSLPFLLGLLCGRTEIFFYYVEVFDASNAYFDVDTPSNSFSPDGEPFVPKQCRLLLNVLSFLH